MNDLGQLGLETRGNNFSRRFAQQQPNNVLSRNPSSYSLDITTPKQIDSFHTMQVVNIACGESHALALTKD